MILCFLPESQSVPRANARKGRGAVMGSAAGFRTPMVGLLVNGFLAEMLGQHVIDHGAILVAL